MEASIELLRRAARPALTGTELAGFRKLADAVTNWPATLLLADAHGISPLVFEHLSASGARLDDQGRRTALALVGRHRATCEIQQRLLVDVVQSFNRAGVDHLVLKGAALAHLVYSRPALRPMRDLDILVARRDAARALDVLHQLGCALSKSPVRQRRHHHLPAAVCRREGLPVAIEVHVDAISRDQPVTLRLDRVGWALSSSARIRLLLPHATRRPGLTIANYDVMRDGRFIMLRRELARMTRPLARVTCVVTSPAPPQHGRHEQRERHNEQGR